MNSPARLVTEDYATSAAAPDDTPSARARANDDEGRFNRVVLPHLADAHALARWLTGSDNDAYDVVQEASIRALRGIDTYANGNARAWVLAIVRNTAYDWLHQNRPPALIYVDRLEDVEGALPTNPEATTPESTLIRIEDETLLDTAISALPHPFREALLFRDIQGLTYRDIAVRSGVSIGTVMSRLFRARRQLIALMNPRTHNGAGPLRLDSLYRAYSSPESL